MISFKGFLVNEELVLSWAEDDSFDSFDSMCFPSDFFSSAIEDEDDLLSAVAAVPTGEDIFDPN